MTTDVDAYSCPICLDVLEKPTRISCGHLYCESCLSPMLTVPEPRCPVCRKIFKPSTTIIDKNMQQQIHIGKSKCPQCSKQIRLSHLKSHSCLKAKVSHTFKPVAVSKQVPQDVPNRATFQCPYCGMKNLDTNGLVRHCNEQHGDSAAQVVCPVCASMPWGDPSQTSGNFLQHLNMRHKFEYDTFVDYSQDDDAMMRAALQASLEEHWGPPLDKLCAHLLCDKDLTQILCTLGVK